MVENQPRSNFRFIDTQATRKVFDLRKRIRAVAGGTSASKTISILVWLIDYCQSPENKGKLCTVVSESYTHLEHGAMTDFKNIMKDREYWREDLWHGTKHEYTFETGNKLEFLSVDTYSKAHGPRRDVLLLNECNNLAYNIADQLMVRTREIVFMDWNPTNEFWFYTEILDKREDVDFITLTYLDNEGLDPVTIAEIESHKNNKAWWQVYGLGQLGQIEGRIYTGWNIYDELPKEARLVRYGLDFGYSIDPTVILAIYQYNNSFIWDEVVYQKGLSNRTIADILNNYDPALVVADSAEPKSIDEIASYGVSIMGAKKGPGSVMQGIQYVQGQKIGVTARSLRTLKAYRNYLFKQDRDGKFINEPDDTIHEWSNPMDAGRYGMDSLRPTKPRQIQTDFGGVPSFIPGMIA